MSKWITNSLPVVQICNLDIVMTVVKVVYKSKPINTEDGQKKNVSRIVGVECKTIDENGKPFLQMIHSKELIPLSVAMKGKIEAYKFINREGEYTNY